MVPSSTSRRLFAPRALWALATVVGCCVTLTVADSADAQNSSVREVNQFGPQPVIHNVATAPERIDLIVNTSRILTLDKRIPRAQVNNPNILELTPLSATQVQIHARQPGVTQVNLWDENDNIHSIDVMIYADARELAIMLQSQFPKASLKVVPLANSVIIHGYVDDPNQVNRIIEIAQQYHPNVINNITVGGVQQVLLQIRVMEISRTKMRQLGVDWAYLNNTGDFVASGITGLLSMTAVNTGTIATGGGETFSFGLVGNNEAFFGFIEALKQDNMAKILAEPNMVTVSGRPAFFNVGGEFPIVVPQSLGTVSIEYRRYGTQVDFVPVVLGNGGIRLEVRPRVSEIDDSRSVLINNINVPGLRVREIDTGVEMRAGQTLAIAGLVQNRVESSVRGLPWVSEIPWVGAAFRRVREQNNEIELLILVTPHLVDAMDPHEVPLCGPGMATTRPCDLDFYGRGHIEVPAPGPCGAIGCPPDGAAGPQQLLPPGAETVPAGETIESAIDPLPLPPAEIPAEGAGHQDESMASEAGGSQTLEITLPSHRRQDRQNPSETDQSSTVVPLPAVEKNPPPGFIGPVGYDVVK